MLCKYSLLEQLAGDNHLLSQEDWEQPLDYLQILLFKNLKEKLMLKKRLNRKPTYFKDLKSL